jgi:hypothetical protein
VWLIKTDANGNKQWDRTFGGSMVRLGAARCSRRAMAASSWWDTHGPSAPGGPDVWLIKTDADGNKLWDRTFGGSSYDYGYSVQQTSDGGFIIVGATTSFGAGDYDVLLIKSRP